MFGNFIKKHKKYFLLAPIFLGVFFLSTYELTESPPPWRDEGIFTQVAKNFAEQGVYGVQISPGHFISTGFITTGYPVIYPVALSFFLFGANIFTARLVMVLFIFLLFVSLYFLIKKESSFFYAVLSLLLIVSFAPIYGQGKNVIGEVPGTALLLLLLFLFSCAENSSKISKTSTILLGLLSGLVMATKPIFLIVLIPSITIGFLFFKPLHFFKERRLFFLYLITSIVPILFWIFTNFHGDSLKEITNIYSGNQEDINVFSLLFKNIIHVVTNIETIYFFGLIFLWMVSIFLSKKFDYKISFTEKISFIFSLLMSMAYLVSIGYYRYFFPAEVIALAYLPLILSRIIIPFFKKKLSLYSSSQTILVILIMGLFLFQMKQTLFHSFVSDFYGSKRTSMLKHNLGNLDGEKILVFDVPEAVIFLPDNNYFQYFQFSNTRRGEEQLQNILPSKIPDKIISHSLSWQKEPDIVQNYELEIHLGKYDILKKK